MATPKETFATQCRDLSTTLAVARNQARDLHKKFFDKTWNTGAGQIVDADIASVQISRADIDVFITMAEQIGNFFGNLAVTTADYQATLNKMRTDI